MASCCNHPPTWFRFGIIALAVIVLCSCRADGRIYGAIEGPEQNPVAATFDQMRVDPSVGLASAVEPSTADAASPASTRVDDQIQVAAAPRPTPVRMTDAQLARASGAPMDCPAPPFEPGSCPACLPSDIRGPSDEYLCDGGDVGPPAAVVRTREVTGL